MKNNSFCTSLLFFLPFLLLFLFILLPLPFPKIRFSKVFMFIKNIINVYNLIYNLIFNTLYNNHPLIKFNQFKYSQLMFLKNKQKYLKNIKNLFLWNKKKLYKILLSGTERVLKKWEFLLHTFTTPALKASLKKLYNFKYKVLRNENFKFEVSSFYLHFDPYN